MTKRPGRRLPGTPTPEHRWLGTDGLMLAGDSWGDPDAPLVLLQHGGGQTRHAWKGVGESLGAVGHHAAALDARGHGDSDWSPDSRYSQDAMVEDLCAVVSTLSDKRPVLVGAFMGGALQALLLWAKIASMRRRWYLSISRPTSNRQG